jgi:hypothetical protein
VSLQLDCFGCHDYPEKPPAASTQARMPKYPVGPPPPVPSPRHPEGARGRGREGVRSGGHG